MTEQYQCQSHYDDDSILRDCTCGKCEKYDLTTKHQEEIEAYQVGISKIASELRKAGLNKTADKIDSDLELLKENPAVENVLSDTTTTKTDKQNCIECGEPVGEHESIKNCHGLCRIQL